MADITKTEIKQMIVDELQKAIKAELAKMVEEELSSLLKDKKIKNDIGDISKDILKKLYKDLSLHHGYVIDRVKF